ncbi:MAG: hypothetical protein NXI23_20325 [Bacteroidetes bacterium]|nr:hypothetical protein [Bacteroidota bacterium]MDF1864459.1 hypothetical protein [Saprospiraceae bacterium]
MGKLYFSSSLILFLVIANLLIGCIGKKQKQSSDLKQLSDTVKYETNKIMDEITINENSDFPKLIWEDEWKGEIILPAWQGFQNRAGGYGHRNKQEPSLGLSKLRLDNIKHGEKNLPDPSQLKAIEFLIENEQLIKETIMNKLLPYYTQLRIDWGEEDWMPKVHSKEDFKNMIGLSWIHVLNVEKEGIAYIGFEMGCQWDEEHGLGVMLHKDRVVEIGGADSSFLSWVAEKDKTKE